MHDRGHALLPIMDEADADIHTAWGVMAAKPKPPKCSTVCADLVK